MIVTTTPSVEGYKVAGYDGIVFGEAHHRHQLPARLRRRHPQHRGWPQPGVRGRLQQARTEALAELEQRAAALGAHAVIGVDVDYEVLGQGNMLMVSASGTAVTLTQA